MIIINFTMNFTAWLKMYVEVWIDESGWKAVGVRGLRAV